MSNWQERTKLLFGEEKLKRLQQSHVLIVGLGGVGAYAAEQIVRAGVGEVTIVDGDRVHPGNRNRQLAALEYRGHGKSPCDAAEIARYKPRLKNSCRKRVYPRRAHDRDSEPSLRLCGGCH